MLLLGMLSLPPCEWTWARLLDGERPHGVNHQTWGWGHQLLADRQPVSKPRRDQLSWLRPELQSWCSDSWTDKWYCSKLLSVGTVCYAAKTNWFRGRIDNLLSSPQFGIMRNRHRNQAGGEAALLLWEAWLKKVALGFLPMQVCWEPGS